MKATVNDIKSQVARLSEKKKSYSFKTLKLKPYA